MQVHEEVLGYAVALSEATREHPAVSLGGLAARVHRFDKGGPGAGATQGRDFVGPQDVKEMAPDALPHRLSVRGGTSGATAEGVVREVLKSVPSPA